MFCGNCGKEIADNSQFCPYCGDKFVNDNLSPQINDANKYTKIFISPDEQYIASLGNNYLNSFLSFRKLKRCVALLSDKRVYLHGAMVDINNGSISRYNIEKVINLEDITGTGFIFAREQIWKLILAVLTAFTIIPPILLIVSYIINRNTMFFIEYAGGSIRFDASIYGMAESQDFHKQIRRMQDKLKEK